MKRNDMDIYEQMAAKIASAVRDKNESYAHATQKTSVAMRLIWPEGIPPEMYEEAFTSMMILHKLCRVAADPAAYGEDAWLDMAGYVLLQMIDNEN